MTLRERATVRLLVVGEHMPDLDIVGGKLADHSKVCNEPGSHVPAPQPGNVAIAAR